MGEPTYHERKLRTYKRFLLALPGLVVLFSRFLVGTRTVRPDIFWTALVVVGLIVAVTLFGAAWHYSILRAVRTDIGA